MVDRATRGEDGGGGRGLEMGGRRGGTGGVADGRWLGRLDGQKERKRGLAQPAWSFGGGRS